MGSPPVKTSKLLGYLAQHPVGDAYVELHCKLGVGGTTRYRLPGLRGWAMHLTGGAFFRVWRSLSIPWSGDEPKSVQTFAVLGPSLRAVAWALGGPVPDGEVRRLDPDMPAVA